MAIFYSSHDVWAGYRSDVQSLAMRGLDSGRRVGDYFGGRGGLFFEVATPEGMPIAAVRVEWLGPGHSRGEIVLSLRPGCQRPAPEG